MKLLLDGARELGHIVCSHIRALLNELHSLRRRGGDVVASSSSAGGAGTSGVSAGASTSPEEAEAEVAERTRGVLQDRFTKDFVVVAAQSKPKTGGYELQLPSMASLTSKTSSQAFFLRILKVILQLRDAARMEAAKAKRKQTELAAAAAVAAAAASAATAATPSTTPSTTPSATAAPAASAAPQESGAAAAAPAAAPAATENVEVPAPMEVDEVAGAKDFELPRLSQQLLLDSLWNTLSECLQVTGNFGD